MIQEQSKLTSQGQVSVPASVRRALGLSPGALLEWWEVDGQIVVRRAATHSSLVAHEALFGDDVASERSSAKRKPKTLAELKQGVSEHVLRRHARN